jgi:hypothetical protein
MRKFLQLLFLSLLLFTLRSPVVYAATSCTIEALNAGDLRPASMTNIHFLVTNTDTTDGNAVSIIVPNPWACGVGSSPGWTVDTSSGSRADYTANILPAGESDTFDLEIATGSDENTVVITGLIDGNECDAVVSMHHEALPVQTYTMDEQVLGAASDLIASMTYVQMMQIMAVIAICGSLVVTIFGLRKFLYKSRRMMNSENNFTANGKYYTYRGSTRGVYSSANPTQKKLEDAWNKGDLEGAQHIINGMDLDDPYRKSMENLQDMKVAESKKT